MIKINFAAIVNQSINIFYTAIFFSPVICFWKDYYTTVFLKITLYLTILTFFLPSRVYTFLQVSQSSKFYRKIGIPKFQQLTQQGNLAQKLTKYFGGNSSLLSKEQKVDKLKRQISTFESFHCACLLFFVLTASYALFHQSLIFFFTIIVSNIFYNVIPILIQQYNRIRLINIINNGK